MQVIDASYRCKLLMQVIDASYRWKSVDGSIDGSIDGYLQFVIRAFALAHGAVLAWRHHTVDKLKLDGVVCKVYVAAYGKLHGSCQVRRNTSFHNNPPPHNVWTSRHIPLSRFSRIHHGLHCFNSQSKQRSPCLESPIPESRRGFPDHCVWATLAPLVSPPPKKVALVFHI